jgi:hypothetical protein
VVVSDKMPEAGLVAHTCFQQLLSGRDHFGELMDGGPKLFLQVANTGRASAGYEAWMVGCLQEGGVCCSRVSLG